MLRVVGEIMLIKVIMDIFCYNRFIPALKYSYDYTYASELPKNVSQCSDQFKDLSSFIRNAFYIRRL